MNALDYKETGQQLALFNSGDWKDYILERLRAFCARLKREGSTTFKVEDFAATLQPWEQPTSRNAYGSLPKIACKAGIIEPTNEYVKATRASTHARVVKVWRVV